MISFNCSRCSDVNGLTNFVGVFIARLFYRRIYAQVLRSVQLAESSLYIKPRTPRLNGKVERSHSTDQQEFYQLLSYKDDVDLEAKLMEWETFYNCHHPHASLKGKTPYEILLEKLQSNPTSTEVISSTPRNITTSRVNARTETGSDMKYTSSASLVCRRSLSVPAS